MQLEAELQHLLQNIRSQTVTQTTNACSLGTADGFSIYGYILDGAASTEVSYDLAYLTLQQYNGDLQAESDLHSKFATQKASS